MISRDQKKALHSDVVRNDIVQTPHRHYTPALVIQFICEKETSAERDHRFTLPPQILSLQLLFPYYYFLNDKLKVI